ncbi:MAG: DapH/DapD/GlmU-related protein [Bacteroidota bacterium]
MKLILTIIYVFERWKILTSELMKFFLRLNGATIGKNTYISISSKIVGGKIIIGKDCRILEQVRIKASELIVGDSVIISSGCMFTGKSRLSIGDKTYIGKKARIDLSREVKIGNDVGFGENSIIWTHGYFPPADEGYPVTYAPVSIEDRAWVSTGIIVLPGVTIGRKAIIGAGSVITKTVPEGMIVAGNPGKIIKEVKQILNEKEFVIILEEIIDQFKPDYIINKRNNEKYICYEFQTFEIHVIDGIEISASNFNSRKKHIVLFKNIDKGYIKIIKQYYWFNFNEKIRIRSNYREVIEMSGFLQGFGIRFLIND